MIGAFSITFLSTPPSRVATIAGLIVNADFDVSIHATLAGGDGKAALKLARIIRFLSTPPSRVATMTFGTLQTRL